SEVPLSQIPIVDKATAIKLGNRELGEMADLVSQFEISDMYTQINYNNSQIRVSPLMYSDLIKWFTNQGDGIPYYVKINIATQETSLIKTQDPIKYSPYEHFNRYLIRHLRFLYPFDMFEAPVFELDDAGRPFWVVPVYEYEIGVIGGKDIVSVIVVDAATGESQKYNIGDVPQWIDNVFPAKLLNIQANNWGKYSNGWVNSIFTQRNVVTTASGYNSIVLNGDLWMYTGLTSVTDDQSNVGYILSNMRTKETKFYQIKGANEESAMRSAEGKVQEKKYNATFPILVNIADKPTYFLSLKDDAGLIKQFAFVCAEQYQIVGVGDSLLLAQNAYIQQLKANGANVYEESNFKAGNIIDINMAVVDGNTNYYFKLKDEPNLIFVAPISVSSNLPFVKIEDYVEIKYTERDSSENLKTINEIKIVM
ncbi:MAG: CvpA family protein, partial [Oscillospiraceae bacterium]|nr:CvpA family protein [Oscillospiraceae bacterium]